MVVPKLHYWEKPFKNKVFCNASIICDIKKCQYKLTLREKSMLAGMDSRQLIIYKQFPECEKWAENVELAKDKLQKLELAQLMVERYCET